MLSPQNSSNSTERKPPLLAEPSLRLTAAGPREQRPARIERLHRVMEGAAHALADFGSAAPRKKDKDAARHRLAEAVRALHDARGRLTVCWRRPPSWEEKTAFSLAWEGIHEDADNIAHEVTDGGAA